MSDLPPDIPEAAPADGPSEPGVLAEIWSNIWPWDDLIAKGPPQRWLKLGQDIVASLSALVAQGPTGPKLVRSRGDGSLAVGAKIDQSTPIGAPSLAGAQQVTVIDSSIFTSGAPIHFKIQNGANIGKGEINIVTRIDPGGVINLLVPNQFAYAVTDLAYIDPSIVIFGQPIATYTSGASFGNGVVTGPQIPVAIVAGMAAGAAVTLVGGVGGQTAYVLGGTVGFDATSTGVNLEDTAGTNRYNFPDIATDHTLDLKGAPIGPVGLGIRIHNSTGVSVNARGTLVYGQG